MTPTDRSASAVVRTLVRPVYLPTLLSSSGSTAVLPVVPLIALRLGFSVPAAAGLTVLAGVVGVIGPIPIGRLMSRWGERRMMVATGIALMVVNLAGWWLVGDTSSAWSDRQRRAGFVGVLVISALTIQCWMLGRQSYLGSVVPPLHRATAMSTFGGMMRVGSVIGPALGALVIVGDHLERVYLLEMALMALATLMVALFLAPGDRRAESPAASGAQRIDPADASPYAPERPALTSMLLTGLGVLPLVVGRSARPVVLPLIGAALGIPASQIALIFAVAAVFDIALFAPAGVLMDRRGRAAVAVPCLLVMGGGYALLPLLTPLAAHANPLTVTVALGVLAVVIAIGNGFGAGIVMTIGLDLSPERARTAHLARWNTILGAGRLAAPALVSGVALALPVAASGALVGGLCIAGGLWLARWLPQVTPRRG